MREIELEFKNIATKITSTVTNAADRGWRVGLRWEAMLKTRIQIIDVEPVL